MSYVPINAAIIAAAAAKAAKDRAEEEKMTTYKSDDLDKWEFKIVRSSTGKFKKPEAVRTLCAQEAKAGWELLEKFDNCRIRFKRRVEKRAQDQYLEVDPYRSSVSSLDGRLGLIILGLVLLLGGLVAFFAIGFDVEVTDPSRIWILVAIVATGLLAVAVALTRRRQG
ncbi:MAG: hypothetical protein OEV49_14900 [candidate division Zixibacteria bacterium]|nr:hypothetical protein [candidate division Zixibacteria bacterium]MDH3938115.1 hypothetical protein [candidate division Zixibacteria bacterium]MDH4033506.1 hypothetical protein [candidate division Zixibacteria bacterium]